MMRPRTLLLVAGLSLGASGCSALRPHQPGDPSAGLVAVLSRAAEEVSSGRYGIADKALTDFAAQFPGSAEANEVLFWRAVYKLDPANQVATTHDASALLDAYLLLPPPVQAHRTEALILRRLAVALEARTLAAPMPSGGGGSSARGDERGRDEELQKLRDELAKTNAELERVRRRVAQPKP